MKSDHRINRRVDGLYTRAGRALQVIDSTLWREFCALGWFGLSGIHWRLDAVYGMLLREVPALSILADQSNNYSGESFDGFTIEKFDGTTVSV